MNEVDYAIFAGLILAVLWIIRWGRRAIRKAATQDRTNTHRLK